jgi:hypothetical protein
MSTGSRSRWRDNRVLSHSIAVLAPRRHDQSPMAGHAAIVARVTTDDGNPSSGRYR